jgi:hypothetical protein
MEAVEPGVGQIWLQGEGRGWKAREGAKRDGPREASQPDET